MVSVVIRCKRLGEKKVELPSIPELLENLSDGIIFFQLAVRTTATERNEILLHLKRERKFFFVLTCWVFRIGSSPFHGSRQCFLAFCGKHHEERRK